MFVNAKKQGYKVDWCELRVYDLPELCNVIDKIIHDGVTFYLQDG